MAGSGWQWLASCLVMGWSWQGSRCTAAFWQAVLSNCVFCPALVQAAQPWRVCNLNAGEDTALPCQNHSCLRFVRSCCNQALAQAVRKGLERLAVAGMLPCHCKGQGARRQAGKLFCNYVFRPALVQAALPWKVCNLNARVDTVLPCQITAACGLSGPAVIRHWHKRSERACSGWQWLECFLVMGWS